MQTASEFRETQSTNRRKLSTRDECNKNCRSDCSQHLPINRSSQFPNMTLSSRPFSSSLIGNLMLHEQLTIDNRGNNIGNAFRMSPAVSIMNSNAIIPSNRISEEDSDESCESDPETKELDDYLTRRLEKLEIEKKTKLNKISEKNKPFIKNKSKLK